MSGAQKNKGKKKTARPFLALVEGTMPIRGLTAPFIDRQLRRFILDPDQLDYRHFQNIEITFNSAKERRRVLRALRDLNSILNVHGLFKFK